MNNPMKSATRRVRAFLCLLLSGRSCEGEGSTKFYAAPYVYQTNADGSATLTGYTGPGRSVVRPQNISNFPVTGLYNTFAAAPWLPNITITNVTIPGTVVSIDGAFCCCAALTNITIPARHQHWLWRISILHRFERHYNSGKRDEYRGLGVRGLLQPVGHHDPRQRRQHRRLSVPVLREPHKRGDDERPDEYRGICIRL